ncbi:MAG: hypothetical protein DRJ26_02840 [Candidatus Methanomethylicota archaeon]|uniref:Uncharacterized protein n=1 Tax=Thermoproteota archaeon TaxID=2056631 RepID=A0A497F2E5_9CREN|nr:MAG: hypothetical protein DRJ26_02840 [Candidatus Verstraetearchaeota archaeon]
MAWGWGRGRRGWIGPWPGRGPFSHLPPWMRPGWLFGRGACWWLFGAPWGLRWYYPMFYPMYYPYYMYYPWMSWWMYYPMYYTPWMRPWWW